MKKTSTTPAPTRSVEARLASVEAELVRVKALAEGAQRTAYRMNERFESIFIGISKATDVSLDPYGSKDTIDDAIREDECERAGLIESGESEA